MSALPVRFAAGKKKTEGLHDSFIKTLSRVRNSNKHIYAWRCHYQSFQQESEEDVERRTRGI